MSELTLEALKAEHDRLGAMLRQFEAAASSTCFEYAGEQISLSAGEIYVGTIVLPDPTLSRHIVLMPGEQEKLTWEEAKQWAMDRGGILPDRVESALLFARLKGVFREEWYWTRDQHASDSGCAWIQVFSYGLQRLINTDDRFRARAVRRLPLE